LIFTLGIFSGVDLLSSYSRIRIFGAGWGKIHGEISLERIGETIYIFHTYTMEDTRQVNRYFHYAEKRFSSSSIIELIIGRAPKIFQDVDKKF
jgi:hypothetical protein